MKLVAVVDDRIDVRRRLAKPIRRYFKKEGIDWEVKDFAPLECEEDYPNWISNNKVVILIVDERLKEEANDGAYANYNGHDVVRVIREVNKQLPIYIITTHTEDDALNTMKGEFDDVINRTVFTSKDESEPYLKRFVRATQSYLSNYEDEYLKLAELAELTVLDKASEVQRNELRALQTKLQIPLSSFNLSDRNSWLGELEEVVQKLDDLSKEIKSYLEE